MKKSLLAVPAILALLLAGCSTSPADRGYDPILEFDAKTIQGESFDAGVLSGQDTLIWFWTPWCAICAQESQDIRELQEAHPDVQFLGIAGYGTQDEMLNFVDRTGTDAFVHLADNDGALWANFQVPIQPSLVVINQDGQAELHVGPATREVAEELLQEILDN